MTSTNIIKETLNHQEDVINKTKLEELVDYMNEVFKIDKKETSFGWQQIEKRRIKLGISQKDAANYIKINRRVYQNSLTSQIVWKGASLKNITKKKHIQIEKLIEEIKINEQAASNMTKWSVKYGQDLLNKQINNGEIKIYRLMFPTINDKLENISMLAIQTNQRMKMVDAVNNQGNKVVYFCYDTYILFVLKDFNNSNMPLDEWEEL